MFGATKKVKKVAVNLAKTKAKKANILKSLFNVAKNITKLPAKAKAAVQGEIKNLKYSSPAQKAATLKKIKTLASEKTAVALENVKKAKKHKEDNAKKKAGLLKAKAKIATLPADKKKKLAMLAKKLMARKYDININLNLKKG